jgi:hypothetical protein
MVNAGGSVHSGFTRVSKRCENPVRVRHSADGWQDRDQVEDAELAKKESSEPMPRNVLDFKDHPYYALERHLKHNEVIHPKREAGKLSTGKGADAVEPIYRRQDVQIVKSADKWYRGGREIKVSQGSTRGNITVTNTNTGWRATAQVRHSQTNSS